MTSINSLIKKDAIVQEEVPGFPGFLVTVAYPGRDGLANIRKAATGQKLRRGGQLEETFDEDKFIHKFVETCIKGWQGFKVSYLQELVVAETGELDPDQEIEFSVENAVALMSNSPTFDGWITDVVTDIKNFTKAR